MRYTLSWKKGILWGLVTLVIGVALFVFVGTKIDATCKTTDTPGVGCSTYSVVNAVVQGYSDVWRHIFAPRCVGGQGPDDCIGPDALIMMTTLFIAGFLVGGISKKKTQIVPDKTA